MRHEPNRPRVTPGSMVDPRLSSIEAQRLWFELHRREWSSLVVVPADPGRSASGIAMSLAKAGELLSDSALRVLNAEGMGPGVIADMIADLKRIRDLSSSPLLARAGSPWRVVVTIESVLSNPQGIGLAQAADAVLLCVRKSQTKLAAARKTVELIGREHFVGSVILSGEQR